MKTVQSYQFQARSFRLVGHRQGGDHQPATGRSGNPLTFEPYGELRDLFRELVYASDVKAVVMTRRGRKFLLRRRRARIIGPLVRMQEADDMGGLLAFAHDRRSGQGDAREGEQPAHVVRFLHRTERADDFVHVAAVPALAGQHHGLSSSLA